ncbi:MAG TPA: VC0807 family protein [Jatrophihabitantaceae bacterium]|jgi:hypothetical protein|nr:VC0807 family protein [Jatrophihabitantaceae bacterium]
MPAKPVHVIDLASPRVIAAYAGRTVLFASVLPMAVFYLTLSLEGLATAVAVTALWYYAGLLIRLTRKRPLMGAAFLGAGLMTIRAFVTFWTGSAFLYFLQPVAGTVATATAIAVTALAGRPLLERLMHDFVPLPGPLAERLRANRFFDYTSLIWAAVYLVNAAGTVWLLTNASLGGFLVLKTVLSPILTGTAVGASYLLFQWLMRREGVQIRWSSTHPVVSTAH